MKLTIAGAGQRYSVELEEQECLAWFKELVGQIVCAAAKDDQSDLEVERLGPEKVAPCCLSDEPAFTPTVQGYSGFLYIECPECKESTGFYIWNEMSEYRCKACGHKHELPELVPLSVKCQCGKSFPYMTNRTEPMFDVNCVECGCPVSVEYHDNTKSYETIWV